MPCVCRVCAVCVWCVWYQYGVQRTLRKSFHRYLAFQKDNNDLLFYVLQAMVRFFFFRIAATARRAHPCP
jgi:hypothetical protein